MIEHELPQADGGPTIRPKGQLEAGDFERLAQEGDPDSAANGRLHGLTIDAAASPGWTGFAAAVAPLRFVRDRHRAIERVAVVSDRRFLTVAPGIAAHVVQADRRHSPESQRGAARAWLPGHT